MSAGPSAATQLPLSGRSNSGGVAAPGTVSVDQATTNAGGANSVNLIQSSTNIQGPYSGSTANGVNNSQVLLLTLSRSLELGLRFNLGAVTQTQSVLQAEGLRRVARSTLLPNVNTVISEQVERLNVRTLGIKSPEFPLTSQFNYFDARAARLTQTIFDVVRTENLHSATETLRSSLSSARDARDLVVLAVAGGYLQIIATNARITAAAAQVQTSRAVFEQASDRLNAGLNARVDATRSQVQLQTDEQRLRSLQADLETQKLRLARIIGLPRGQRFQAVEEYPFAPLSGVDVDGALSKANSNRMDLQASEASVRAAENALKAARAERLPSLSLTADWGVAGLRPDASAHSVYSVAGTLNIPLYEGGRIKGDVQQATATLQQRQAEREDLLGQVDQDVRQAFIDLSSAADQVGVAKSNVGLSRETLQQSRDRFISGIADTVELVQAEQSVVQADNDYITAVYEHNLAKVALARAMGNAEQTLPAFLKR